MATYKKKLKTLAVHLMLDGEAVTIADTATDDMATRALNEFKRYETMHYETTEGSDKITNAIPYHAVQYIEVTETEADITKADPYGCDEGGSDTVTITFTAKSGGKIAKLYAECGLRIGCDESSEEFSNPMSVAKGTAIVLPKCIIGEDDVSNCITTYESEDGNHTAGTEYVAEKDVTLVAVDSL